MLNGMISQIKEFRDNIYSAIHYRSDACMELLDSLCSNTSADSVVKLSLNSHHRRGYSSITDVVSEFDKGGIEQEEELSELLVSQVCSDSNQRAYHLLCLDCTPAPRPHAPTLEDRSYVYAPNQIPGNKPITIGHKYSTLAFLPMKNEDTPPWILPLNTKRVAPLIESDISVGAEQLEATLTNIWKKEPNKLCVNVADSGYSKREFVYSQSQQVNLVTIVRSTSNRVFYRKAKEERSRYGNKRGHKLWYGDAFRLLDGDTWCEPEGVAEIATKTRKGKSCTVKIEYWNDMLMRQKDGFQMQDCPFTLVRASMTDEYGNHVFHKPLWLLVFGERRDELIAEQIYQCYMQRYDIEHFFKFEKQHLLVDKFQTPDTQHEENWWTICTLSYAMLFSCRKVCSNVPRPWERYLPEMNAVTGCVAPAQVQRSFHELTKMIGTPAKSPQKRGSSLGRSVGAQQPKRIRNIIVKKATPNRENMAA